MKNQSHFLDQQIKPNRTMERPMLEMAIRINEKRMRFAAEGSSNETKNQQLRERGDHTRLEAWRLDEFLREAIYLSVEILVYSPGRLTVLWVMPFYDLFITHIITQERKWTVHLVILFTVLFENWCPRPRDASATSHPTNATRRNHFSTVLCPEHETDPTVSPQRLQEGPPPLKVKRLTLRLTLHWLFP